MKETGPQQQQSSSSSSTTNTPTSIQQQTTTTDSVSLSTIQRQNEKVSFESSLSSSLQHTPLSYQLEQENNQQQQEQEVVTRLMNSSLTNDINRNMNQNGITAVASTSQQQQQQQNQHQLNNNHNIPDDLFSSSSYSSSSERDLLGTTHVNGSIGTGLSGTSTSCGSSDKSSSSSGIKESLDAGMIALRRFVRARKPPTKTADARTTTTTSFATSEAPMELESFATTEEMLNLCFSSSSSSTTTPTPTTIRTSDDSISRTNRNEMTPLHRRVPYESYNKEGHTKKPDWNSQSTTTIPCTSTSTTTGSTINMDEAANRRQRAVSEPDVLHVRDYLSIENDNCTTTTAGGGGGGGGQMGQNVTTTTAQNHHQHLNDNNNSCSSPSVLPQQQNQIRRRRQQNQHDNNNSRDHQLPPLHTHSMNRSFQTQTQKQQQQPPHSHSFNNTNTNMNSHHNYTYSSSSRRRAFTTSTTEIDDKDSLFRIFDDMNDNDDDCGDAITTSVCTDHDPTNHSQPIDFFHHPTTHIKNNEEVNYHHHQQQHNTTTESTWISGGPLEMVGMGNSIVANHPLQLLPPLYTDTSPLETQQQQQQQQNRSMNGTMLDNMTAAPHLGITQPTPQLVNLLNHHHHPSEQPPLDHNNFSSIYDTHQGTVLHTTHQHHVVTGNNNTNGMEQRHRRNSNEMGNRNHTITTNSNNNSNRNNNYNTNHTTNTDPERHSRLRWMQINRRFQFVIAIVALIFSLLLFGILLGWVVLTGTFIVSYRKCSGALRVYYFLATFQLVLDIFRNDIMNVIFHWDSRSNQRIPCRVMSYNIGYLIYALLVLRLGITNVFESDQSNNIECREDAPAFFSASVAFVSLSISAWITIVFGYFIPFCVVACLLTYNGYNPSSSSVRTMNNVDNNSGGTGLTQPVFPSPYTMAGAPPDCIDYIRIVPMATYPLEYPKECCICMEDFKDHDIVVETNCHHVFHKSCCKEWLRQARTCPVCRDDIPTKHLPNNHHMFHSNGDATSTIAYDTTTLTTTTNITNNDATTTTTPATTTTTIVGTGPLRRSSLSIVSSAGDNSHSTTTTNPTTIPTINQSIGSTGDSNSQPVHGYLRILRYFTQSDVTTN